jgi:hypothetical protein
MTPQKKAIDLLFIYWRNADLTPEQAKQCALIAVNEIWNALESARVFEEYDYWQEVKKEIEKL